MSRGGSRKYRASSRVCCNNFNYKTTTYYKDATGRKRFEKRTNEYTRWKPIYFDNSYFRMKRQFGRIPSRRVQKDGTLTVVFYLRRCAHGVVAIEAKIICIAKRTVRIEIGILESSSRYRISACYLDAFFRRVLPVQIAATCVTKTNNIAISPRRLSREAD